MTIRTTSKGVKIRFAEKNVTLPTTRFEFLSTPEALLSRLAGVPWRTLQNDWVKLDGQITTFKILAEHVRDQGFWGAASTKDQEVYAWVEPYRNNLLQIFWFMAHEIAHLAKPSWGKLRVGAYSRDENRAELFGVVTSLAAYHLNSFISKLKGKHELPASNRLLDSRTPKGEVLRRVSRRVRVPGSGAARRQVRRRRASRVQRAGSRLSLQGCRA